MTLTSQPSSEGGLPSALRAKVRYRSDEASVYLATVHGLTVAMRTLDKYRSVGGGPRFQKFNRSALYHRDDLDAWASDKLGATKTSTADNGDADD